MFLPRTLSITIVLHLGVFQLVVLAQKVEETQLDQLKDALLWGDPIATMKISGEMRQASPDHADTHTALGIVAMVQKNLNLAKKHFTSATELQANHPVASAYLARILIVQRQVKEGEGILNKALVAHPEAPDLLDLRAELQVRQGKVDDSIATYKRIVDNTENSDLQRATCYMKIAQIYVLKKDSPSVIRTLESSLNVEWTPQAAIALMQHYVASQQPMKANKVQDKIVTQANTERFKSKRMQMLKAIEGPTVLNNFMLIGHYLDQAEYNAREVSKLIYHNRLILDKMKTAEAKTKLKELDGLEFRHEYRELKGLVAEKAASNSISRIANNIVKLAPSVTVKDKDAILDYAKKQLASGDEVAKEQSKIALQLVKKQDYRLHDFTHPSIAFKKILKQHKLPEYLSSSAITELKNYYREQEKLRKVPVYKDLVIQFAANPSDNTLQKKLAAAYLSHIKDIDIKRDQATDEALYPRRYWDQIPLVRNSPTGERSYAERKSAAYALHDLGALSYLEDNEKWKESVAYNTRMLKKFPSNKALLNRAQAYIHLQNYQAAAEDYAALSAVLAWDRAERYIPPNQINGQGPNPGFAQIAKDLHLLVTGDQSPETQKARKLLQSIHSKQWDDVVDFVKAPSPSLGLLKALHYELSYTKAWNSSLSQHLSEKLHRLSGKAAADYYKKHHNLIYSSVAATLYKNQSEKSLDKKINALERCLNYSKTEGRSVAGHYELAQLYLKKNEKQRARIHLNVAARGLASSKLTGLAKKAAQQRNVLEGKRSKNENFQMCLNDDKYLVSLYAKERYKKNLNMLRAEVFTRMRLFTNQDNAIKDNRGRVYATGTEPALAKADLIAATPTKGSESVFYALLGQSCRDLGEFKEAIKYLELARKHGNKSSFIYNTLGMMHCSQMDYQKALELQNEQLKHTPETVSALILRSKLHQYAFANDEAALKDIDKAIAMLKKQGVNPKNMTYFSLLNRKTSILGDRLNGIFRK